MDKYKIKDLKSRLEKENFDNAHKMLYMWIKQNHITLKEYTKLVKNLTIGANGWYG